MEVEWFRWVEVDSVRAGRDFIQDECHRLHELDPDLSIIVLSKNILEGSWNSRLRVVRPECGDGVRGLGCDLLIVDNPHIVDKFIWNQCIALASRGRHPHILAVMYHTERPQNLMHIESMLKFMRN